MEKKFLLSTSPGFGGIEAFTIAKNLLSDLGQSVSGFSLSSFYDNFDPKSGIKNAEMNLEYHRELRHFCYLSIYFFDSFKAQLSQLDLSHKKSLSHVVEWIAWCWLFCVIKLA